ncbi:hypothetical protein [Methylomonas sp. AM2-LC]|uniref:hypothetical protein n=1 Tax=Methylomonas sp. AM2-LC TaxID=3153301 RepID=UPI003262D753
MTFFAVYASLAVGLSLCATALIMAQRGAVPEQNRRLFRLALTLPSMRAGIALLLAPTVTVALATALMAGMFSA